MFSLQGVGMKNISEPSGGLQRNLELSYFNHDWHPYQEHIDWIISLYTYHGHNLWLPHTWTKLLRLKFENRTNRTWRYDMCLRLKCKGTKWGIILLYHTNLTIFLKWERYSNINPQSLRLEENMPASQDSFRLLGLTWQSCHHNADFNSERHWWKESLYISPSFKLYSW